MGGDTVCWVKGEEGVGVIVCWMREEGGGRLWKFHERFSGLDGMHRCGFGGASSLCTWIVSLLELHMSRISALSEELATALLDLYFDCL